MTCRAPREIERGRLIAFYRDLSTRILANAAGCDLECPGQHQRERKTQQHDHDQEGQRPGRQAQRLEGHFADLHQHPTDQDVDQPNANDLAVFQLPPEAFAGLCVHHFSRPYFTRAGSAQPPAGA